MFGVNLKLLLTFVLQFVLKLHSTKGLSSEYFIQGGRALWFIYFYLYKLLCDTSKAHCVKCVTDIISV